MSRIARKPLVIPAGVEVNINANREASVKGKKGTLNYTLHKDVIVETAGNQITVKPSAAPSAMVGTTCKILKNMMEGVHQGFERKLTLVGVGYRAKTQGAGIELSLGFSHPVQYTPPAGIVIEVPSNTEIVVKGINKHLVGQTAADIRAFRPPEMYKLKGIRFFNEVLQAKEVKKK